MEATVSGPQVRASEHIALGSLASPTAVRRPPSASFLNLASQYGGRYHRRVKRLPLDVFGLVLLASACAFAYWQRPAPARRPPLAAVAPPKEAEEPLIVEQSFRLELEDDGFAGSGHNREGVELARAGRYAEAAAKLRRAVEASPTNQLVRRNLQAVGLAPLRGFEICAVPARSAAIEAPGWPRRGADRPCVPQVRGQRRRRTDRRARLIQRGAGAGRFHDFRGAIGRPTIACVPWKAAARRKRGYESQKVCRLASLRRREREVDAEWPSEESSRHFQARDAGEYKPAVARGVAVPESAIATSSGANWLPPGSPMPVSFAERDFHSITTFDRAGAAHDGRLKFPGADSSPAATSIG
jgi:hypothetical protein